MRNAHCAYFDLFSSLVAGAAMKAGDPTIGPNNDVHDFE